MGGIIMIKAIEYIKTGFSADDALKISAAIDSVLESGEKVVVDFDGITIFTTLFFNNAFTKHVLTMGPDVYKQKFELQNLSELGETTYKHSFDNAVNYFNMSDDAKKTHDEVTENADD